MTNSELRKSIAERTRRVMKDLGIRYQDINISDKYETVSVGDHFFAQGEDAAAIISEIVPLAIKTKLSEKTCLLYLLDSAGVFQK